MPTDTVEAKDKLASKNDNEALLQEIRDRFKYATNAWTEIRDEAIKDRRYVLGDPWDEKDKKERADVGRPCISHDELGQYLNQYVNGVRQSPPGIKYDPTGEGSSEKTSQLYQDLVRSIEFQSDASSAYVGAAEDAAEGSYGFFRLSREYVSDQSFDQRITLNAILNPDAVVYDPDCKKPDWSDARYAFVLDPVPREEFARLYKNASKTDFSAEDSRIAPEWIQGKTILTAEYWRVDVKERTLILWADGSTGFADEYDGKLEGDTFVTRNIERDAKGRIKGKTEKRAPVRKFRNLAFRTIEQFITNGVEILKKTEQPGTIIPIIAVIGKEMYVDDGGGAKRRLISLVRLARDPQMSLAYLNSLEMEEAGLTPKVPYMGYKGQFESDAEAWEEITKVPHSIIQADPIVDAATNQVLPLPVRQQFTPNFQAYEVAKDSCRRAIQAAMGIMPLPTAAQRDSEKSGIAIQRIQSQQTVGSFHFTSNLHRAIRLAGKVMEEWIPVVYDAERQVALTQADGTRKLVKINTDQPYDNGKGEQEHFPVTEARHDITISVAPSSESTREAASDFLDSLITNLQVLPVAPPVAAKLLAMSIQMKGLGPKGDQMAEIIAPPDPNNMPPQAQAAISQAQQQLAQLQEENAKLNGVVQKLMVERQGRVIENEYKLRLADKQAAVKITEADKDRLTKLEVAEITTKFQDLKQRMEAWLELMTQFHQQAHEASMQAADHAHEADQAQQQRDAATEQQMTQIGAEQAATAQQQNQPEAGA